MLVIMKQSVWNTWVDTAREPMKIDLLVKNVIQYPYETQRRKHFKCQIESKHDGPMYPCKDCEAPINAEAILKCDKCKHTLVFRTLMLKHTHAIHDDIREAFKIKKVPNLGTGVYNAR